MPGRSGYDVNNQPTLLALSAADDRQPVELWADPVTHGLIISASLSISGADGAITDGVDALIKATVLDYASSNPLAVRLTDTAGDYVGAGGGTQYTEDAAAAANPIGTALNLIRADSLSGLTTTDGDNVAARGTDKGELYVKHADSIAITSATLATAAKQDSLLTELQLKADLTETQPVSLATVPSHAVTNAGTFAVQATEADGANVTLGAKADAKSTATDTTAVSAMSVLKQISASVQAPPSQAVTNAGTFAVQATLASETTKVIGTVNQGTSPWVTSNATTSVVGNGAAATAQRVTLANDSTGIIATVSAVTAITNALPAGTNAIGKLAANSGVDIGDVDVTSVPADPFGANADAASATGSISAKLRFIASTGIPITGTVTVGSHAVTNAGTFVTQIDGAALTALQLIDDPVFADDAAYTLSTSKTAVTGGVAVQTDGTDPTAVSAEGDAAALRTDMTRILLVNTTPPRLTSASENNATAQTNNPILSAPGASLSLYITDIIVSNGATAGSIRFVEDTGGTPVIKVQETYMAINGGAVIPLKTPIRITANKDFGYTSTTVTTHSITVSGYIAP